jgi:Cu/Ag efflux pump CusA
MLDRLLDYSLKNRLSSFVLATLLALAGYFSYRDLTIEAFPILRTPRCR